MTDAELIQNLTTRLATLEETAVYSQGGWVSFVPSWTNVTTTDATTYGYYRYVPGGIRVQGGITFGAGTEFTGNVDVTLPNSETSRAGSGRSLGVVNCKDGFGDLTGHCHVPPGSTTLQFFAGGDNVNATTPHVWASGDDLWFDITVAL